MAGLFKFWEIKVPTHVVSATDPKPTSWWCPYVNTAINGNQPVSSEVSGDRPSRLLSAFSFELAAKTYMADTSVSACALVDVRPGKRHSGGAEPVSNPRF